MGDFSSCSGRTQFIVILCVVLKLALGTTLTDLSHLEGNERSFRVVTHQRLTDIWSAENPL